MVAFYHSLVGIGLWRDVLAWCVGFTCALIYGALKGFQIFKKLNMVIDRLDTTTEGGLEVIHKDLKHLQEKLSPGDTDEDKI